LTSVDRAFVFVSIGIVYLLMVISMINFVPVEAQSETATVTQPRTIEPVMGQARSPPQVPIDGTSPNCNEIELEALYFIDYDIPDPGWVWVDPNNRFQSVSGNVTKTKVSHTDFPAVHDSHDNTAHIEVDPGQLHLLSNINPPNSKGGHLERIEDRGPPTKIEIESETGILPTELTGDGENPMFPKWAWPNEGDRVWANGHWVFDCGHGKKVGGELRTRTQKIGRHDFEQSYWYDTVTYYRTEIHPIRAIATMREQVLPLPGTDGTPFPVIATDFYIHGRGGAATNSLNCGIDFILKDNPENCDPIYYRPDEIRNRPDLTPIDDNYLFEICLPYKPAQESLLALSIEDGPRNTIDIHPKFELIPATEACSSFSNSPVSIQVLVPLYDSGIHPEDVYARKILTGWIFEGNQDLHHFQITLNKMDLHDDKDTIGDCECTFFWVSIDKAPNEWHRIVDYEIPTDDDASILCGNHINRMNDYDDDANCGNGNLRFSGPTWDFFVKDGDSFHIRANGYDQDCLDDLMGDYSLDLSELADCYVGSGFWESETGDNDKFPKFLKRFEAPTYGIGIVPSGGGITKEIELPMVEPQYVDYEAPNGVITQIKNPDNEYDLFFTFKKLPYNYQEVDLTQVLLTTGKARYAPGQESSIYFWTELDIIKVVPPDVATAPSSTSQVALPEDDTPTTDVSKMKADEFKKLPVKELATIDSKDIEKIEDPNLKKMINEKMIQKATDYVKQAPSKIKQQASPGMVFEEDPILSSTVRILLPPNLQIRNGVSPDDVVCNEGLELIKRTTNGKPVCVLESTAELLLERGWAVP